MATERAEAVVDWRPPERRNSEVALKQQHARRKILVVDDEPLLRTFVVRVLKSSSYDVIEADSAERAIELLAAEGKACALLLSDVGLPGISGAELVKVARRLVPNLPTQLMSGTPKRRLLADGVLTRDDHLLEKPFGVADLLGRVEQLVGI